MDWSKWKCRCHALGMLTTEPKLVEDKKAGNLSQTAKSYLKKVYAEIKYGREDDFTSKYTTKGVITEPICIELLSKLDGKEYKKNETRIEDEYFSGIPDIYEGEDIYKSDYIIDNKSSWSLFTFIINVGSKLDKDYLAQLNGYLKLTNCKRGEVSYCLVSAPESIILSEKRRLLYQMDVATEESPEYVEAAAGLEYGMIFPDIPAVERRIKYVVERDDEFIKKAQDAVVKGRLYLAEIEKMHTNGV